MHRTRGTTATSTSRSRTRLRAARRRRFSTRCASLFPIPCSFLPSPWSRPPCPTPARPQPFRLHFRRRPSADRVVCVCGRTLTVCQVVMNHGHLPSTRAPRSPHLSLAHLASAIASVCPILVKTPRLCARNQTRVSIVLALGCDRAGSALQVLNVGRGCCVSQSVWGREGCGDRVARGWRGVDRWPRFSRRASVGLQVRSEKAGMTGVLYSWTRVLGSYLHQCVRENSKQVHGDWDGR